MKMKSLFLSWVLVFCASGNLAEAFDGGILSTGKDHTCAIDDEGVKCWGRSDFGQTKVPPLKNPTYVSAGRYHTCAIDDEEVKCWGANGFGQTTVPQLKYPTLVSAGGGHTCAIDDEGVKCWGYSGDGRTKVPPLKNPTFVSAGTDHTCAIDDEGVKCWGRNDSGPTEVPPLKNPTYVSAGRDYTCAIDDDGLKCWGRNDEGQTEVPPLKNPTLVSAGDYHTCAIDDEEVKCWGAGYSVAPLKNPTFVSAGGEHTCAIDDEEVKCWGADYFGETKVPSLNLSGFTKLEILIDRLAHWSTPVRTSFFNLIVPFWKSNFKSKRIFSVPDYIVHGRHILMALLKSSIETGDSAYYIEKVIPVYQSRLKAFNEETGIHGLDQVKDYPLTRLIALKVMQASLATMTEFLTAEDKTHIQDIIKLIGQAMTDVSNKQLIINALNAIDTNEAIIDKLSHSSKTQFLVLTLKTAQQWLKAKIQ